MSSAGPGPQAAQSQAAESQSLQGDKTGRGNIAGSSGKRPSQLERERIAQEKIAAAARGRAER